MDTGMKLRQGVKAYMKRKKLTQQDLAAILGVSASRLAQILVAGAVPPPEMALKIAHLCGLDPVEIVFWSVEQRVGPMKSHELRVDDSVRYTPLVMQRLREATIKVDILGITGIRRIRNSRDGFRNLLASGGTLRVGLLDVTCPAFTERRSHESDGDDEFLADDNQVTLRMNAEFYVSTEVLKGLSSFAKHVGRGSVEFRVFNECPRVAIVIADSGLAYKYVYRHRHVGERGPVQICLDAKDKLFHEIETDFKEIWDKSRKVTLNDFAPRSASLPLKLTDLLQQ